VNRFLQSFCFIVTFFFATNSFTVPKPLYYMRRITIPKGGMTRRQAIAFAKIKARLRPMRANRRTIYFVNSLTLPHAQEVKNRIAARLTAHQETSSLPLPLPTIADSYRPLKSIDISENNKNNKQKDTTHKDTITIETKLQKDLFPAIEAGNVQKVQELIHQGLSPRIKATNGFNAFHVAIQTAIEHAGDAQNEFLYAQLLKIIKNFCDMDYIHCEHTQSVDESSLTIKDRQGKTVNDYLKEYSFINDLSFDLLFGEDNEQLLNTQLDRLQKIIKEHEEKLETKSKTYQSKSHNKLVPVIKTDDSQQEHTTMHRCLSPYPTMYGFSVPEEATTKHARDRSVQSEPLKIEKRRTRYTASNTIPLIFEEEDDYPFFNALELEQDDREFPHEIHKAQKYHERLCDLGK
jgi:hypothetical protein